MTQHIGIQNMVHRYKVSKQKMKIECNNECSRTERREIIERKIEMQKIHDIVNNNHNNKSMHDFNYCKEPKSMTPQS